jgi:hypothetical protein
MDYTTIEREQRGNFSISIENCLESMADHLYIKRDIGGYKEIYLFTNDYKRIKEFSNSVEGTYGDIHVDLEVIKIINKYTNGRW